MASVPELQGPELAIRAAEEGAAGAASAAAPYLRLAHERLARAQQMARRGDYETAEILGRQVKLDAELALALAERERALRRAAAAADRLRKLREREDEAAMGGQGRAGRLGP